MRKRAPAPHGYDASFIAPDQEDQTVKLHRQAYSIAHDDLSAENTRFRRKTAYEIKMKYASLDIKVVKEIYFLEAVTRTVEIITDFLNARPLY